jgi:hypothetical protein
MAPPPYPEVKPCSCNSDSAGTAERLPANVVLGMPGGWHGTMHETDHTYEHHFSAAKGQAVRCRKENERQPGDCEVIGPAVRGGNGEKAKKIIAAVILVDGEAGAVL